MQPERAHCQAAATPGHSCCHALIHTTILDLTPRRQAAVDKAWYGVPAFIGTGKRLPIMQTQLRLIFKTPNSASPTSKAAPSPISW